MKAVTMTLYICGGLMATAAVMGFIDYKAAKHNGKLKSLYKDEKTMPVGTKTIEIDDYSRGPIPPLPPRKAAYNNMQSKETKVAKKAEAVVASSTLEAEQPTATPLPKRKKKIRFSEFSRAALPVEYGVDGEMVKATMDSTEKKAWDY